jgi:hypothetical protein
MGSEAAFDLFPVIESPVWNSSADVSEFSCLRDLIEFVSDVAVAFESQFTDCITLLLSLSKQSRTIQNHFTSEEALFYAKIEEAIAKCSPSLAKVRTLFDLTMFIRPAKASRVCPQQPRARVRVPLRGHFPEGEEWIVGEFAPRGASAEPASVREVLRRGVDHRRHSSGWSRISFSPRKRTPEPLS